MTKLGPVTEVIRFAQHENKVARLRALKFERSYIRTLLKKTIGKIPAETKFFGGPPFQWSFVTGKSELSMDR